MRCNRKPCPNEADEGYKSCKRCRDRAELYYAKYRKENPKRDGQCSRKDCPNLADPGFRSCTSCRYKTNTRAISIRPTLRIKSASYYQKLKTEVFEAYGGFICACCGDTNREFLSIDHTNGDGPKHRKEMTGNPRNGQTLYYWLRDHDFPPGFRVLCMNCNFSLGHHGYCPHHPEIRQPFVSGRPRKELPNVQPSSVQSLHDLGEHVNESIDSWPCTTG